jgi:hypothetical protein
VPAGRPHTNSQSTKSPPTLATIAAAAAVSWATACKNRSKGEESRSPRRSSTTRTIRRAAIRGLMHQHYFRHFVPHFSILVHAYFSMKACSFWRLFPSKLYRKWPPGPKNDLERRVSQFYTICDKNQLLNKNIGKVMAILVLTCTGLGAPD